MKQEDAPVGRLISRRDALALAGGAACLALGGWAAADGPEPVPACVVRPEQTEGPYFVEEALERSDIRSDPATGKVKPGAPLALTFAVSRLTAAGDCRPLPGARVDLWQCDAAGVYSDVDDPGFSTRGQKFLRGHQVTGDGGRVSFLTVYPGWYPGRTVHVHFKVRTEPTAGHALEFTSQLYFDDAVTDRVHATAPYGTRGTRRRNAGDRIFRRGGDQLLLAPAESDGAYSAGFSLALRIP
jgi:protocatechuate 3,4-dioxygenase beta subunit